MALRDEQFNPGIALNQGPVLVVGLGNIGPEYEKTRHNAGFLALDHFAKQYDLGQFIRKADLDAEVIETRMSDQKVILAKPHTFMNKSGLAVVKLQNYFAVNDPRILIVYDDVDVDFGTIRLRIGGSSGGHNGIKSIEQVIGSDFAKIRIGVRNEHLERTDTADFVLTAFSRAEHQSLAPVLDAVSNSVHAFITDSFEETSHTLI